MDLGPSNMNPSTGIMRIKADQVEDGLIMLPFFSHRFRLAEVMHGPKKPKMIPADPSRQFPVREILLELPQHKPGMFAQVYPSQKPTFPE